MTKIKELIFHHIKNGSVRPSNQKKKTSQQIKVKQKQLTSRTLQENEVPAFLREPFIASGYRDADRITVRQCIASAFTIHNETFNIWSHFIAAIGLFLYAVRYIVVQDVIVNPLVYPLLCFVISSCIMLLSSSFAHLFCCMSWKARHACFYIDYAAISLFSLGSATGFVFYSRPELGQSYPLYNNPYAFLSISSVISAVNTYFCCISRHKFIKYRFLLRTGLYVVKLLFDVSPFWARCGFYQSNICSNPVLNQINWFTLCFLVSGVVNASRLPERLFPGYFDLFGHSHHILHILGAAGIYIVFNLFLLEIDDRQAFLSHSIYPPTFLTTFGFLIILISIDCCIVTWFVLTWLQAEEDELFSGSKYLAIYKSNETSCEINRNKTKPHTKKTQ